MTSSLYAQNLKLNDLDYFQDRGLNIMVFSNPPGGMFSDAKTSGIEIIHHGVRTATNGDVRLHHTPEQWDYLPQYEDRTIDKENNSIEARLSYPDYDFSYSIQARAVDGKMHLSVHLEEALPDELAGRAGFNLEFLPAEYFGKMFFMDGNTGLFPRHPSGEMDMRDDGETEPRPFARGRKLVLAPEDPERYVRITSDQNELLLFDGRTKAQNGWYVVRSMLPSGETGAVIEWTLEAHTIADWTRTPVITHSQVGYHPNQKKKAVIELDQNDNQRPEVRLLSINGNGEFEEAYSDDAEEWGQYLRYDYVTFDFSDIREEGLYIIEYGEERTSPFRISADAYEDTWHLTSDIFFPVQMDHVKVREAYRVWHGASHLDDALQAPPNHEHFDLYAQGDGTETDYEPFEHIPGLNIGGWYDAGDYDIRTQTQYFVVQNLVHAWEQFDLDRDNTTVSQEKRYVEIHLPDGKPDILQQIEHGTLALIAQYRALGRAIPGIVDGRLYQYPHLGDGMTRTDNLVYNPDLDPFDLAESERFNSGHFEAKTTAPRPEERTMNSDGETSGVFDDRWAFTSRSTPLNYGSAAALAAASRVLRGFNDELAEESLETAIGVWELEQGKEPDLFRFGNTTGGPLEAEELKATVELLISTGDRQYSDRLTELLPQVEERFMMSASMLAMAIPHMDDEYAAKMEDLTRTYSENLDYFNEENPFGVPISRGGWAGGGGVIGFAITNYNLHKAFPDLIDADYVVRGLNYIFGTHPGSNISFVSAVGTESQLVAYGMNRADFSFIPGGIVPGVLVLPPDFPENKQNWPFFWGQNEYVVNVGASYIFLANAVHELLSAGR